MGHAGYLRLVPPRSSAQSLLKKTFREGVALFGSIPEANGNYSYATGRWTVKQVLMHLIDFERVMAFRTLSFMRGDRIGLPGFNQDFWMEEVHLEDRSIASLLKEWKTVRDNTLNLLGQCTEAQSRFPGRAANWKVTPRALFFIIVGHQIHHHNVLRELYVEAWALSVER
jgi:uncharacterized damage-inducible protein DinB